MNYGITVPETLKKLFASVAIFSLLATSLPVGAYVALADEGDEVKSTEVVEAPAETPAEETPATPAEDGDKDLEITSDNGDTADNAEDNDTDINAGDGSDNSKDNATSTLNGLGEDNDVPKTKGIKNFIQSKFSEIYNQVASVFAQPNEVTFVSNTENSITLNFVIGNGDFNDAACFDVESDSLTTLPTAQTSICLGVGTDIDITFNDVYEWIEVSEFLLSGEHSDPQHFDVAPVAPTISICSVYDNVHTTDLSNWDLSETRITGHNEIVAEGLHVWNDGNTSTDKAAGYRSVSFNLKDLGVGSQVFTSSGAGVLPSLQLLTDLDNDGQPDGYLVGEPVSYGADTLWLSSNWNSIDITHAPTSVNGGGTGKGGTVNDWLAVFPNAKVVAIGYSLGSGVHGDYIVSKINAGCTEYTFGLSINENPTFTVDAPSEGSLVSTKINGDRLHITGLFIDDVKANYANLQLVYQGVSKAIGTIYGYGSVFNPLATYADINGDYVYNLDVPTDLEDGDYSLFYIGTDFEGGITDRMERKFIIDNTVPTTPSIIKPTARQWFKTTPIQTEWTSASDANGIKGYQVAYAYDDGHLMNASDCPDVTAINGTNISGCRNASGTSRGQVPGIDEQGGVTAWVRAVDNAGNVSPWSASVHYFYDATAPATDIMVSPVIDGKFTVSGTATDNLALNRVYVQLVSRVTSERCGGTTLNLITSPFSTNYPWSVDYDIATLKVTGTSTSCMAGNFAAHVSVTDNAGNTGTAGWTDNFLVEAPDNTDTTAPAAPTGFGWKDSLANVIAYGGVTDDESGLAYWDANTESDFDHYIYKYWNDISSSSYNDEASSWSVDAGSNEMAGVFNQGEGTHYFCVMAVDHAGNVSACSEPFKVIYKIDNSTPTNPEDGNGDEDNNGGEQNQSPEPNFTPSRNVTSGGRVAGVSAGLPAGQVLGASTDAEGDFCTDPYITTNLAFGWANSVEQVTRLQSFLNRTIGAGLPVTGFFGELTRQAVMNFQTKYASDILAPWGISNATGMVYHTTKKKINELVCDGQTTFPLTEKQLEEIAEVKVHPEAVVVDTTSKTAPSGEVAGASTSSTKTTDTNTETLGSNDDSQNTIDTTGTANVDNNKPGFFKKLWNSIFGN